MFSGEWVVLKQSYFNIPDLVNNLWIWSITQTIVILFIFLWIISIIRVAKDISARTSNNFIQIISILLITLLSPIIWLPLYLIFRPIHYHKDKIFWREAITLDTLVCYNCDFLNNKKNNFCTNCWEPLKLKCKNCSQMSCYNSTYCEHCWSPNFDS